VFAAFCVGLLANAVLPGRVGDSPLIGAGTYADDAGGAVSTTGKGESFNPGRGSSFIDASRYYNLYDPLVQLIERVAAAVRPLQSGDVNLYLLYVFLVVLIAYLIYPY